MTSDVAERAKQEAERAFAHALGLTSSESRIEVVGNQEFLHFIVGRNAPIYDHALREADKALDEENPFRGLTGLSIEKASTFTKSREALVLLGLLSRATRKVSERPISSSFPLPFVSFPNREDLKVIQPATQLIVGRRGVGKSTLVAQAVQTLRHSRKVAVVLDMQAYGIPRTDPHVVVDILADLSVALADTVSAIAGGSPGAAARLVAFSEALLSGQEDVDRAGVNLKRIIQEVSRTTQSEVFIFLDDYHLVDSSLQPLVAHTLHGATKGAGGWLKLAGIRSLLSVFDASRKIGLQTPGDAQIVSLDFTLSDPVAAEAHLRSILESFLRFIGIDSLPAVIDERAFFRLAWANAGVPRDFLQMFASSVENAKKANRARVTLTDANLAIGELGQQKVAELEQDAQNADLLGRVLKFIERHCLERKQDRVNAFLVKQDSPEYEYVQALSDLRLVHLLHRTITPYKAGERYEAYMLDYSLFTGFRRRPNIREVLPAEGTTFTASELRKLPALPVGFVQDLMDEVE